MTVMDVAGATTGGAARWRREAESWLGRHPDAGVSIVGSGHRVEPRWLLERERYGWRERRIATNSVSYVGGTGTRVVILCNALHFLRAGEADTLPAVPSSIARQSIVIRQVLRRADIIVVPCTDMSERVAAAVPWARSRLVTRFHPVSPLPLPRSKSQHPYILVPMLPSPHKDLPGAVQDLTEAIDRLGSSLSIVVTAPEADAGVAARHASVAMIGPQSFADLDKLWAGATAVYAPTTVESFGFPVAEGRAYGVPVLALGTPRNREIGGNMLIPFRAKDADSLAGAIRESEGVDCASDPDPFDPEDYFSWLIGR